MFSMFLNVCQLLCETEKKKRKKWRLILPKRPFLPIGSEVGFTYKEQVDSLMKLMKACMQQVKLMVHIDSINHPPRGLSGS